MDIAWGWRDTRPTRSEPGHDAPRRGRGLKRSALIREQPSAGLRAKRMLGVSMTPSRLLWHVVEPAIDQIGGRASSHD